MTRCRVAAIVALTATLLVPALADEGPRIENALPVAPPRDGGPLYMMGELQWDRPELLEGRLRFVVRNGHDVVSVVETDPMAAVAGGTRFRQLIPLAHSLSASGQSDIDMNFVTESQRFPIHQTGVRLPQPGQWESVLLSCEPTRGAGLGAAKELREALLFERCFSEPAVSGFGIQSYSPTLSAQEFPEQPLAYCAFDGLLIPAEGLSRLNGRQLDAIAAWSRAGGAICLTVEGQLDARRLEFLNDLFHDASAGPFIADAEGHLIPPAETKDGIYHSRVGMGYAVLLFDPKEQVDLDGKAWREAHARYWRLRESLVHERERGRTVDEVLRPLGGSAIPIRPGGAILSGEPLSADYIPATAHWSFHAPSFGTAIVEALRPSDIRLMSGWTIVLILMGYVALVGPIDYLVLGRLRLRKWTWLVFPAVSLGVAWGVVATTNAFMSSNDHVRSIDIVDLDRNGEPVRRTRLDLHFRGSSEGLLHEVEGGFFSSLSQDHFHTNYVYGPTGQMQPERTLNDAPTGPYVGTVPSRFVVPQQVAKWTPQVNRTFEIAPEIALPAIDWNRFEKESPSPVTLDDGRTGSCIRIAGGQLSGPAGPLGTVLPPGTSYSIRNNWLQQEAPRLHTEPFLQGATESLAVERSSILFQRSPLGLGRLDDLPIADSQTSRDVVLVLWLQDAAGNVSVYRKLVGPGSTTP